jgi:GT2 family glycosyltransferase
MEPAQAQRNPMNLGFAGNCNAGAMRARGDVLLFLNQDTVAREGWFEPLIAMFDSPAVGIVGPKLITGGFANAYAIQSCGGLYGGNKGPYHRFLGWNANDWRVNVCEKVSWMTGAALAIRREVFMQIGGFDVGYARGYFEDVDLCEKVKAQGLEVWYCPTSTFEHNAGTSGGVPAHIFKANSLRFHQKWDAVIVPDTAVSHVNF